jgi:uncharacterized protein
VEFEGDPEKAESNFRKHRVRFAEAQTIFNDDNVVTMFDETSDEERYVVIGRSYRGRILLTVYTIREERIRLISSRKATRAERRQYENQE